MTSLTGNHGWLAHPEIIAESLILIQSIALLKGFVRAVTILLTAAVANIALINTSSSTSLSTVNKVAGGSWRRESRCC